MAEESLKLLCFNQAHHQGRMVEVMSWEEENGGRQPGVKRKAIGANPAACGRKGSLWIVTQMGKFSFLIVAFDALAILDDSHCQQASKQANKQASKRIITRGIAPHHWSVMPI